ncbi:alpha/beta fold hydrolase [Streptomyces sp. NPDC102476]|uniref:alpha/beta fold hydrolase n=1 Tax=Streptomyces sp. NPDC102476 TaxID=3366181 RepID=UPI003823A5A8
MTVYHAHIAARPELAGRRSLFLDLPGHGVGDRPEDFGYTLEGYADALATALDAADPPGGEVVAHRMDGSVALVLAHRRPELVSRLVLTEANLDVSPPATAGSTWIDAYEEDDFVAGAHARVLKKFGPVGGDHPVGRPARPAPQRDRAQARIACTCWPCRRHCPQRRTPPSPTTMMRAILEALSIDRVYLQGELSGELEGRKMLEASGVRVVTVPGAGHNVMLDNPDAVVAAVAGTE